MQKDVDVNNFDLELYQQFHKQDCLINPFKNIEVEKTPVQFLLFTDSPGWGNQHPLSATQENSKDELGINRHKIQNTIKKEVLQTDKWKDGRYNHINFNTSRAMGAYKLAHEVREHGFTCQVVDNLMHLDIETTKRIIDKFVGEETLLIGVSSTFRSFQLLPMRSSLSNFDPFEGFTDDEKQDYMDKLFTRGDDNTRVHFFSTGKKGDKELGKYINDINPNVKYIIGGAFVTSKYPKTENNLMDYINLGFGDVTLPQILQHLKDGGDSKHLPENKFGLQVAQDGVSKLDIKHSSMNWRPEDNIQPGEILPLEVARGCIFKCNFCNFRMIGKEKGTYVRASELIRDELIRNYENFGITSYWITDDTFNDDNDRLEAIRDIIQSLPFKVRLVAFIRFDLVMLKKQAELIRDCGLAMIHAGFETINPESAKDLGKGYDPMKQMEYLTELKKDLWKDIYVHSGFMIGLPSDTKKTVREMLNWLRSSENPLDSYYVAALSIALPDKEASAPPSNFAKNPEEFGYEWIPYTQPEIEEYMQDGNFVNYKNKAGLTYEDMINTRNRFEYSMIGHPRQYKRLLISQFQCLGIEGSGLTPKELIEKVKSGEFTSQDCDQIDYNNRQNYMKRLMSIEKHTTFETMELVDADNLKRISIARNLV